MTDPRWETLAEILISHSLRLAEGETDSTSPTAPGRRRKGQVPPPLTLGRATAARWSTPSPTFGGLVRPR